MSLSIDYHSFLQHIIHEWRSGDKGKYVHGYIQVSIQEIIFIINYYYKH